MKKVKNRVSLCLCLGGFILSFSLKFKYLFFPIDAQSWSVIERSI